MQISWKPIFAQQCFLPVIISKMPTITASTNSKVNRSTLTMFARNTKNQVKKIKDHIFSTNRKHSPTTHCHPQTLQQKNSINIPFKLSSNVKRREKKQRIISTSRSINWEFYFNCLNPNTKRKILQPQFFFFCRKNYIARKCRKSQNESWSDIHYKIISKCTE